MTARLMVALVGLLLTGAVVADEGYDARAAEVAAAEQAFADTMAARDLDAFAAMVHPDAVFAGREGPLIGRDAVVEAWSRFFAGPDAPFSWAPETVQVNPEGTLGMSIGPVFDPSGRWVASFASTWEKQTDGRWLVRFDVSPRCPPRADN